MFLFCMGLVFLGAFAYAVKKVNGEEKALKLAEKKAVENRCKLQTLKDENKLRKELGDLRTMREPVSLLSNKNALESNKNALVSNKPLPPVSSQNEEPGFEMVPQNSKKSEIGSKSKKHAADFEEKRSRKETSEAVSPQTTESQAGGWNRMPAGEQLIYQMATPK
uniref:Uncharacterized protein n=1 Tax=Ditylenchus dipsaci TaxID=166011 RepID=A0A915CUG6_9BILA